MKEGIIGRALESIKSGVDVAKDALGGKKHWEKRAEEVLTEKLGYHDLPQKIRDEMSKVLPEKTWHPSLAAVLNPYDVKKFNPGDGSTHYSCKVDEEIEKTHGFLRTPHMVTVIEYPDGTTTTKYEVGEQYFKEKERE